jgi:tetratricopeptide (TPR) repeat protein
MPSAMRSVGDAPGAANALQNAAAALPKDADAWYYLGAARNAAGNRAAAAEAWKTLLVLAPGRADVAANLGRILVELGRADEAVAHLAAAAKALPKNLDVQHDYAVALIETGDPAQAAVSDFAAAHHVVVSVQDHADELVVHHAAVLDDRVSAGDDQRGLTSAAVILAVHHVDAGQRPGALQVDALAPHGGLDDVLVGVAAIRQPYV